METNIQKWGNSLGVRLSKDIVQMQNLKEGSRVLVTSTQKGISIAVAKRKPKTLTQMLKKITEENHHREIEWGTVRGNEVW